MLHKKAWQDLSPEIYHAAGFGGNYIVVDNEHDLIVVVWWMDERKMGDFMSLVEQSIVVKSK